MSDIKRVITFGVFDFYHLGHLRLFKQIRHTVGEPCYLIVAVQNGDHILSQKPEANVLYSTEERREMLEANKYVDEIVIYDTVDRFIGQASFDVFARAPEHTSPSIKKFEEWCFSNHKEVIVTRRTEGISSSLIKQKMVDDLSDTEKRQENREIIKNSETMIYWEDMANSNPTQSTVKVNPQNDHTGYDAEFIMKYADRSSDVLDLASGTGLILNKFYNKVKHIDAVELFPEFTKFIKVSPKITVHNSDIVDFVPQKKYDLILMFGVVQYFSESEVCKLYKRYKKYLKRGGKLIVKNQFGVKEDVVVSGVSKELSKPYYSHYRHTDKEIDILRSAGFHDVKIFDIYPPSANRWDNTHFYALVVE